MTSTAAASMACRPAEAGFEARSIRLSAFSPAGPSAISSLRRASAPRERKVMVTEPAERDRLMIYTSLSYASFSG